ncbi:hypothetical protein NIES4103_11680 [Nostoc sp. NIES-4103]|nr:hypothetical protein NIES4103_11680 [Nostoc sp. NIES-4103]
MLKVEALHISIYDVSVLRFLPHLLANCCISGMLLIAIL